jgi:GMP synthase-like glutamine amidotransferase
MALPLHPQLLEEVGGSLGLVLGVELCSQILAGILGGSIGMKRRPPSGSSDSSALGVLVPFL